MRKNIKTPLVSVLLHWIILIILNLGIPLISVDPSASSIQSYVIAFFYSTFNFLHNPHVIQLIISWILVLTFCSLTSVPKYKFVFSYWFYEFLVLIFTVIFYNRHSPNTFSGEYPTIIYEFLISIALISVLFISIKVRKVIIRKKHKQEIKNQILSKKEIMNKCPYCGTEFRSNPKICYNCSKEI
ncbi:MAG: hypothetical protein GF364_04795 [Candidatus Lokiarchaeota archaeon]|nr:hypothetical protein [Candidatus Lokiarchaeota archaeon]